MGRRIVQYMLCTRVSIWLKFCHILYFGFRYLADITVTSEEQAATV